MNYLQRANLDLLVAWREKYTRCYTEPDPWPFNVRVLLDARLERKRQEARAWLAERSPRWRKKSRVRPIWTARGALARRGRS